MNYSSFPNRATRWLLLTSLLSGLSSVGCSEESSQPAETIRVGAILPFTGKESALGRNLEQAMLLAMEDVNAAGGIDGVPLEVVARDSNSGSQRGYDELSALMYNEQVRYLVGPEETDLANAVVSDIKALDIVNVLPGYAAPSIQRASATGAWLRLAPEAYDIGCAFAMHAIDDGVMSANTLSTRDDYNSKMVNVFNQQYTSFGDVLPSVTVQPDQSSYTSAIDKALDFGPERTVLIANPAVASQIVTEWAIGDHRGAWYLSPLLRADAFLLNVPYGSLDGFLGVSPSLSLRSECDAPTGYTHGSISCRTDNATRFREHFAERWGGARPFPAAHLYYDAIIMLAMGMQYSLGTNGAVPAALKLQQTILDLNGVTREPGHWYDLKALLSDLRAGKPRRLIGAGAEYEFDRWGAAKHVIFDTWSVAAQSFVDAGSYYASCKPL
jgi:neutral amino acid transport system substrate-binding protein